MEPPEIRLTLHARRRWMTRTDHRSSSLGEAWRTSVPVGSPDITGSVRLHPPTDMLLVYSNGKLQTVYQSANEQLNTDHLKRCEACRLYWDPLRFDECNWCANGKASASPGNQHKSIKVTGKPTTTQNGQPDKRP
jgi:hypothetical protein